MAINKDNNCQISGNITQVPNHGSKQGRNGTFSYCNISIAHNPKNKAKEVMYFDCKAYGQVADNMKLNCSKGDSIIIWGELIKEAWKKQPDPKSTRYNYYLQVAEYKNMTSIYGKDKTFEQQEMPSNNNAFADVDGPF